MSSETPPLSQELIDLIIDHLHNHPPSLARCALVARNWVFSSRLHLFSSINLHASRRFYRFSKNLTRLKLFEELLDAAHETITPHIYGVTIFLCLHPDFIKKNIVFLTRILVRLPQLRSLNLLSDPRDTRVREGMFAREIKEEFVKHEYLENWPAAYSHQFVDILYAIPRLERFSAHWGNTLFRCDTSRPFPAHLKHLVLKETKIAMIEWWLSNKSRPKIHTVELQEIMSQEKHLVAFFLKRLAGDVENLKISFRGNGWPEDDFAKAVNLTHNTSLRTIEIGGVDLELRFSILEPNCLLALLSQIKSVNMASTKIWLYVPDINIDRAFDWTAFDRVLSNTPFSRMKFIVFNVYILDRNFDITNAIRSRLPRCSEKYEVVVECPGFSYIGRIPA